MCPKCGKDPCECNKTLLTAPFDTLGVPSRKIQFVKQLDDKETLEISSRRKKRKIVTTSPEDGYEVDDEAEEKLSTSETRVGSVVVKHTSEVESEDLSELLKREDVSTSASVTKRRKTSKPSTSLGVSTKEGDSVSVTDEQTFVEKERKAIKNQERRVHKDPTFKDRKPKPIKNVEYKKIQRGMELKTPFGSVYLEYSEFGGVIVYTEKKSLKNGGFELNFPWGYAAIVKHLDEYVLDCLHKEPPNIKTPKKLIETILSFLNDELPPGITAIGLPFPKNTAAASLCGILYYSEPSRIRDGGKWERTAMRMVLDNFKKAVDGSTPIKEVFAPIFTGDELDDLGNVPIFLMARSPHGFSNSRDVLRVGAYQTPQPGSASETALQKLTNVAEKAAPFVSSDSDQESKNHSKDGSDENH